MKIGYARVSTQEQSLDSQKDALTTAGCEVIFLEHASGKLACRPKLDEMLRSLRPGDQLVVTRLDRLGRSLEHLIALSRDLSDRGIDLAVLEQGVDTSTPVGRMFFQILGAVAEFERALQVERTRDGLAAARARGRTGGRKPKLSPRQIGLASDMLAELDAEGRRVYTVAEIAAQLNVSRPTIYRSLSAAGKQTR